MAEQTPITSIWFTEPTGAFLRVAKHGLSSAQMSGDAQVVTSAYLPQWFPGNGANIGLQIDPSTQFPDVDRRRQTTNVIATVAQADAALPQDPRSVLSAACAALKQHLGGTCDIKVGFELEFRVFAELKAHFSTCETHLRLVPVNGFHDQTRVSDRQPAEFLHLSPVRDRLFDFRLDLQQAAEVTGLDGDFLYPEAGVSQCEIALTSSDPVTSADAFQRAKVLARDVVRAHGFDSTFMPAPLPAQNTSGCHINLSISQDGKALLFDRQGGLSQTGACALAGILKHMKAVAAFSNQTNNSYARLNALFSPVDPVGYAYDHRSSTIRIPKEREDHRMRMELRFPDCVMNPYLTLAAVLMAMLDGIIEKHPLPRPEETARHPLDYTIDDDIGASPLPRTLLDACRALYTGGDFLHRADVFQDATVAAHLDRLFEYAKYRDVLVSNLDYDELLSKP